MLASVGWFLGACVRLTSEEARRDHMLRSEAYDTATRLLVACYILGVCEQCLLGVVAYFLSSSHERSLIYHSRYMTDFEKKFVLEARPDETYIMLRYRVY